MGAPTSINPMIIDGLYCEALVLSDEVRSSFDLSGRLDAAIAADSDVRVAASCEALRTTTRMMHAMAWLLNHRAFFMGDLSEFQLRRHGRLADFPPADPARVAMLDQTRCDLIAATERFYNRLLRLDRGWRQPGPGASKAINTLRERIEISA
jgi:regulator of CtrA degradation